MKRIRILDYILLLHLFELPEEKMDWWARLTFIGSIVLFGCSLIFSLLIFSGPFSNKAGHLSLLANIFYFSSSILSFLVASLQDSDTRARLLWLSTVVLLIGSLILVGALIAIYSAAPLIAR